MSRQFNYIENLWNKTTKKSSHHVWDNTIQGKDVPAETIKLLADKLQFFPEEKIELLYSNDMIFKFKKNVLIGVTQYRLFKLEDEEIITIPRTEITKLKHIKNNSVSWDFLQCELGSSSRVRNIGIWSTEACDNFIDYLQKHPGSLVPDAQKVLQQQEEQDVRNQQLGLVQSIDQKQQQGSSDSPGRLLDSPGRLIDEQEGL